MNERRTHRLWQRAMAKARNVVWEGQRITEALSNVRQQFPSLVRAPLQTFGYKSISTIIGQSQVLETVEHGRTGKCVKSEPKLWTGIFNFEDSSMPKQAIPEWWGAIVQWAFMTNKLLSPRRVLSDETSIPGSTIKQKVAVCCTSQLRSKRASLSDSKIGTGGEKWMHCQPNLIK